MRILIFRLEIRCFICIFCVFVVLISLEMIQYTVLCKMIKCLLEKNLVAFWLKLQCHDFFDFRLFRNCIWPPIISLGPCKISSKIFIDIHSSRWTTNVNDTDGKWNYFWLNNSKFFVWKLFCSSLHLYIFYLASNLKESKIEIFVA